MKLSSKMRNLHYRMSFRSKSRPGINASIRSGKQFAIKWPCKRSLKRLALNMVPRHWIINTLRTRQNGCYFPDDFFQMHILEWKYMNFGQHFTKSPINNIPAMIRIMAWPRPIIIRLPTHICVAGLDELTEICGNTCIRVSFILVIQKGLGTRF